MTSTFAAAICALNDAMRQAGPAGGRWMMTDEVMAQGPIFVLLATRAVQAFSAFTPDNDPYGEHDFGDLTQDDGVGVLSLKMPSRLRRGVAAFCTLCMQKFTISVNFCI